MCCQKDNTDDSLLLRREKYQTFKYNLVVSKVFSQRVPRESSVFVIILYVEVFQSLMRYIDHLKTFFPMGRTDENKSSNGFISDSFLSLISI